MPRRQTGRSRGRTNTAHRPTETTGAEGEMRPNAAHTQDWVYTMTRRPPTTGMHATQVRATGQMLVLMPRESAARGAAIKLMRNKGGVRTVAHAAGDYRGAMNVADAENAQVMVFESLNIAVMRGDDLDAQRAVAATAGAESPISLVEPELFMLALGSDPVTQDWPYVWSIDDRAPERSRPAGDATSYLRGYRDAVNAVCKQLGVDAGAAMSMAAADTTAFTDSPSGAWGLDATNVLRSKRTGNGVRIAILDTGMDLNHPDFASRQIQSASFVPGEQVQDGNGHGTHCIGTACGPLSPISGTRYGIATQATIFAGKVLSDRGSGPDRGILAGIDWALRNGCQVISMSLGVQSPRSRIYDAVGRRALTQGTLIVAAAGNDSRRSAGFTAPVTRPANSDSIMAVGALDPWLRVADFSNVSGDSNAGSVDIAAPGVAVLSAFPTPQNTRKLQGTSMATPHVAGIAALYAEALEKPDGFQLWSLLTAKSRRLGSSTMDVGAGLTLAPT